MSIILESLTLPDEMYWVDEFEWSSVNATTKRTIQGKLIVQESQVPSDAGRSITLSSDDAWISRDDVLSLQTMSNVLDSTLTLSMHDTRTYQCRFRHWDVPCIVAEMIVPTAYPDVETVHRLTLKLVVI